MAKAPPSPADSRDSPRDLLFPGAGADRAREAQVWLQHLAKERRASPHTVEAYQRDLTQFFRFLAEHFGGAPSLTDFSTLAPADVRAFMAQRRAQEIESRSLLRSLAGIRSFARHLERAGKGKASALTAVRTPKIARSLPKPLTASAAVAVADAKTDQEVVHLVRRAVAVPGLLLAGPALVTGVLARLSAPRAERVAPPRLPVGDVVVVRGSRHPVSRAQVEAAAGLPGVVVVEPDAEAGSDPEVVALELAVRAHDVVAATAANIVVLLGGDTADAFIGERSVRLLGSLDTGVACGEMELDGRTITVVAKPGGFGHDLTVRDLLSRRRPS